METSRRSVLKAGGTAALLSVTSLAGCSGILGGGNVSPADYQYDPATLVETQNRFFGLADYAGLYEARENFPESTQESFESSEDTPVNPEDIETMVGVGGAQISMSGSGGGAFFGSLGVLGSFDKSTIEESIQSEDDAQQSGEYEGFTLYENTGSESSNVVGGVPTDSTATAAAGDGAVIIGFAAADGEGEPSVTGDQAARTMIDAGNGDAELLNDNSDYASSLRDRIGDSSVMMGGEVDPGLVEMATQAGGMQTDFVNGIRAGGFGMTVDGETTTMSAVGIYTDSQAAEDSGVVELVDFASDQAVDENPDIDSVDAEYDGNAVVVSVEGQTQTIFDQGMGGGAGGGFDVRRPQAALGRVESIGQ
jgi:hypothetical protein